MKRNSAIKMHLTTLRNELYSLADEKIQQSGRRFFKEEIKTYGIKTAQVSSIAKKHFKSIQNSSKKDIFNLCEELWKSGYLEESFIACQWSYFLRKHYTPDDINVFEEWLNNHVNNWASCDTFCNHTIGNFIMMYPGFLSKLKEWTASENRWVRRGAAVSLIIPARKGMFLNSVFEIADALLTDKDDLVQKGYGWMLKVTSQSHQLEVFNYVMRNKEKMPRTALRYAIEKIPVNMRQEAMRRE